MYGVFEGKIQRKKEESWLHGSAHDGEAVVPSSNGLPPGTNCFGSSSGFQKVSASAPTSALWVPACTVFKLKSRFFMLLWNEYRLN